MTTTFNCGTNYLAPNGFKVSINKENFANLEFFAQSIQHPDISLDPAEIGFPRLSTLPMLGESITNGVLTIEVIMDEDMNVYQEIYDWMNRATREKHTLAPQISGAQLSSYQDVTVSILTSSNNPNRSFRYVNSHPINIGGINFASTLDGTYITFPISFRFDYFEFV